MAKFKKPNFKIKEKISKRIKDRGLKNFIWTIILSVLIAGASLCLVFALYIIISAPNFDKDLLYKKEATVVYDKAGNELARIGNENRVLITYEDLPQVFIDALIATEDSRFYQHNGLDIARFIKATAGQLTGADKAGGASTITMQLIKNTYTSNEATGIKGIIRKFTDIYMAVFKLENCYTKEEILEFYVNSLWMGYDGDLNYTGIYGVEQASQYYFNKSVSELSLAESSLLVGMYQNAYLYNPYKNPEGCRNRQRIVLKLMVNHGYISQDEMDAVLEIPIESMLGNHDVKKATNKFQAAIDYVLKDVEEKTGKNPYSTPMQIYSTIDSDLQEVLYKMEQGEYFTWYNDFDQEGVAITSVENGSVAALSGGRNYQAKGLNRASDIQRQPGSSAKPFFDYAPYIEYLNGSTGDYLFDDPYTYTNGTTIMDADRSYQGMITVRQSLVGSRNITALQLFQKVAKEDLNLIADFVHSFGINYGDNLYESASIGGFDGVSPLQMSAAYATFARGGYYIKPFSFTKVVYENGTSYEYKPTKEKVVSEETSYMITSMLMDAVRDGWSGSININGTNVAGKTGTTTIDDSSIIKLGLPDGTIMDSWSITYSPEYAIALWYGYDELSKEYKMNTTTGWNARSRLMEKLARNVYSTNKSFKRPNGVISVEVEKETVPLQLASEFTPENMRMTELFKDGTEPTEVSTRYAKLSAPSGGKATYDGKLVTLTWNSATAPDNINSEYLLDQFNTNYGNFATKYYEKRVSYNESSIGSFGYQVYQKDKNTGELTSLGWTSTPEYSMTLEAGNTYTFVIKSSYSIFKANQSDSITINIETKADTTVDDSLKDKDKTKKESQLD